MPDDSIAGAAEHAGLELRLPEASGPDAVAAGSAALLRGPPVDLADAPVGQVSAAAGACVLDAFRQALGLARAGALDAICFAPCNKQAMHAGGLAFEDELRFFVHELGHDGYVGEINATGELAGTRTWDFGLRRSRGPRLRRLKPHEPRSQDR